MTRKYEYQSDFAKKHVAQGRAEGRAEGHTIGVAEGTSATRKALYSILKLRGLALTDEQGARIEVARLPELERWIERAATTPSVDALLMDTMMRRGYEVLSEIAEKYIAEGRAAGRVEGHALGAAEGAAATRKALHSILKLRGFALTKEQRAHIEAAQLPELEQWIAQAARTANAEALLKSQDARRRAGLSAP